MPGSRFGSVPVHHLAAQPPDRFNPSVQHGKDNVFPCVSRRMVVLELYEEEKARYLEEYRSHVLRLERQIREKDVISLGTRIVIVKTVRHTIRICAALRIFAATQMMNGKISIE